MYSEILKVALTFLMTATVQVQMAVTVNMESQSHKGMYIDGFFYILCYTCMYVCLDFM